MDAKCVVGMARRVLARGGGATFDVLLIAQTGPLT